MFRILRHEILSNINIDPLISLLVLHLLEQHAITHQDFDVIILVII